MQNEQNDDKKAISGQALTEKEEIIKKQTSDVRKSWNFWVHFIVQLYLTCIPIFINFNIMIIGLKLFTQEQVNFISYFQTFALLLSTIGLGIFMDKYGAKMSSIALTVLLTLALVIFLYFRNNYFFFCISTAIFFIVHGSLDTYKGVFLNKVYNSEIALNLQSLFACSKPLCAILSYALDKYVHMVYGIENTLKL